MSDQRSDVTMDQEQQSYQERQWVPIYWWPIALAFIGLITATIQMGIPKVGIWIPVVAMIPFGAWALIWLSRHRLEVGPDASGTPELRVGRAHLPVNFIARAAVVAPTAKSAALGRQLDPAAYVQHRPWIGPMVLLVLDDPDDPTPYWLVSTRRPDRVLAALGLPNAG